MNETKPIGECYECHKPLYATLGLCEVCELKDEIARLKEELRIQTVQANQYNERIQRLKELLMDIGDDIKDEVGLYGYIEKIEQALAAPPQKGQDNESDTKTARND